MGASLRFAACIGILTILSTSIAWASPEDIIAYARIGERMLVTLGAGLSLWLGYCLFRINAGVRSPVSNTVDTSPVANTERPLDGGIEGNLGDFVRVRMWNVGPGLFFALFGAGLLAFVMYSPVNLDFVAISPMPSEQHMHVSFGFPGMSGEQNADKARSIVRAIRTIRDINDHGGVLPASKNQVDSATLNLQEAIPLIIDLGFGQGAYNVYQRLKVMTPEQRSHSSSAEQSTYNQVDDALNGA
jgi:hypothetical protein